MIRLSFPIDRGFSQTQLAITFGEATATDIQIEQTGFFLSEVLEATQAAA
ncbi:MAG: hypothetical protein P8J37_07695 [Fuerstiella sp.]|jgi:hypothetical protein|nr:hypothetical protein [Fuerstiella sp.]